MRTQNGGDGTLGGPLGMSPPDGSAWDRSRSGGSAVRSREVSLHVAKTSQSTSRAPANSDVRRMPGATALIAHHDEAEAESSASQLESTVG